MPPANECAKARAVTELEQAQLDLVHAQLVYYLLSLPFISNRDIPVALDISPRSWRNIRARGEGPALFEIEGRMYARTKDLLAYVEQRAALGYPGAKPAPKSAPVPGSLAVAQSAQGA